MATSPAPPNEHRRSAEEQGVKVRNIRTDCLQVKGVEEMAADRCCVSKCSIL